MPKNNENRSHICVHDWKSPTCTLLLTASPHGWSACCTKCRRDTGFVLTRDEAIARAEKGWWEK